VRNRGSNLRIVGWIVGWKFRSKAAKFFRMMVARDGVEPPTPAFSDLVQPEPTTTYRFAGDCQVPANTCKAERSWAGIMGCSFFADQQMPHDRDSQCNGDVTTAKRLRPPREVDCFHG